MTALSDSTTALSRAIASPAATATGCAHCGLPVPGGLIRPSEREQFCCAGCETARRVIRAGGLEQFYEVRERLGGVAAPAAAVDDEFGALDDPHFISKRCRALDDGRLAADLFVENIHCAACVWLLERTPTICAGVDEVRVDLGRGMLHVVWRPAATSLSRLARLIGSLGYRVHAARGEERQRVRRREDRAMLIRVGVAGAIAGNVMLASLSIYAGDASGIDPSHMSLFRWVSAALGTLSVCWPGASFVRGAIAGLRARRLNMDTPIAVGLAVGLVYGLYNTITGAGEIYFDTLATLVFLLLLGRWLQRQQQRRASDALETLHALTPFFARVVGDDGAVRTVSVDALTVGAVVEIRPNESVPVDGDVISGESDLNESFLTGEAEPVAATPGKRVFAGSVNLTATIRVAALAAGEATRAGRIMRLMEESAATRAPIVRLADRIAGVFVGVVLSLALVTAALWWAIEPSRAVDNAAALLIVTCPCALGMATPLSVIAALGRAARRGILIKGGEMLEALARPGVLFLDKTGTLTEGCMAVRRWEGPQEIAALVGALESGCAHPIARALAAHAPGAPLRVQRVRHRVGGGIEGCVDGRELAVGSRAFVQATIGSSSSWMDGFESECAAEGLTPVFVGMDGKIAAGAGLGDPLRASARETLDALRSMGWDVRILSGDHGAVVERAAVTLGLDPARCFARVSPEEKLAIVQKAVAEGAGGPVVMVGDGVNDAAALAAATVGVAVSGGAEASLHAAGVYLAGEGLAPLGELLRGARRTMSVIRLALGASLLYNVVVVILAMSGQLSPLIAAALMPLSSLTVISIAFRSRTFGGRGAGKEG